MNVTPEVCLDAWKRLRAFSKTKRLSIQRQLARRRLEANLASLIDAARGHEAQKLPPGAPAYLILHNQSQVLTRAYCEQWQVSSDELNAELPALHKLQQLAQNTQQPSRAATIGLVICASMLFSFILGMAAAFARLGYYLIGGKR
jgi:hypothetical protein